MNFYTNSMLKDWEVCHQKYYYKYIKHIVIPQREENFELGKKVHALISYQLNGFDISLMKNNANPTVIEHFESILKHPLLLQSAFLSEWGFNVRIGNTNDCFMGRIDAVFFNKSDNIYTIADWKTGMKIPEIPQNDVQAKIYLYALYKAKNDLKINIEPEQLQFLFVQSQTLNESGFYFSTELVEEFENYFLKTINDIKKYNFRNEDLSEKNCRYCEYKFICNK